MSSAADNATKQNERKAKVFISYSRKDLAFADRLETALKSHGFEVLIDRAEIYALEDWWQFFGLEFRKGTLSFDL
jgi:hypothetical protein